MMRRDLLGFVALALVLSFPSAGLPQSTTPGSTTKSPRIDVKALTEKANSGNPEAQYKLGLAYEQGVGVEKSDYEAMRWYRMAANNGDTVLVGPGTYGENINFNGKAILANGAFRSIYSPGAVS